MGIRYSILIIIIWICDIGVSQDFIFKWEVLPSLAGKAYTISIEKKNSKGYITIKETGKNDSTINEMFLKDCDSLMAFLDRYEFQTKGNVIYGFKRRQYYETKVLPDTNWIQINEDSLRRELLWVHGYIFDKSNNKCYSEMQSMDYWTDGNNYCGEYIRSNIKRTFNIHSARISNLDFELNNIVYNLAINYDDTRDYSQLKRTLDSDKPKEKK